MGLSTFKKRNGKKVEVVQITYSAGIDPYEGNLTAQEKKLRRESAAKMFGGKSFKKRNDEYVKSLKKSDT